MTETLRAFMPPPSVTVCVALLGVLSACSAAAPAAGAGQWSEIACPHGERDAKDRFDRVRLVEGFEGPGVSWKAVAGPQQARATAVRSTDRKHEGSASLRVDYRFVGKLPYEYVEVSRSVPIERRQLGVGLWVCGDGSGLGLKIRVRDRSGETHQCDLAALDFTGWRYVAVTFDGAGGWWGGDGNGRLDYPCTLHSILADRPKKGYKGKGTFWIDEVRIVRPRRTESALKIEVLGKRVGNIYKPRQTVRLRAGGPRGKIRWRAEDFGSNRIASGSGPATGTKVELRLPSCGFYRITVDRLVAGEVAESRVFSCAALPPADPKRRNGFVGVGCHFRHGAYPLECMDLLVRLGISEFRDEISWSSVEREKGALAMPKYAQAFTARAKALGLNPLLILDYGNAHYEKGGFPTSAESVAAYARYSASLAKWLRGSVREFEVWNEYSIGCGMGGKPRVQTPQTYARMLRAACRAVRKANPKATVVGVGGEHSGHHVKFIEGMFRAGAGGNMDAWSVHSYRYPHSPEETDLLGEIGRVAELGRTCGAPEGIWVTEIGWPTHIAPRGVDERTQARYLVRTLALLQSAGAVRKVHWYDLKDDGLRREYNEHNFGVVHHQKYNLAPKPAAVALSVFARMTAGAKVAGLWQDGPRRAVLYRLADGGQRIVAWSAGRDAAAVLVSAKDGRRLSPTAVHDIVGARIERLPIRLTGSPVYISGYDLKLTGATGRHPPPVPQRAAPSRDASRKGSRP